MIRKDCFWYRPWKDMAATIEQCHLEEVYECPCEIGCENYISTELAENIVKQYIVRRMGF